MHMESHLSVSYTGAIRGDQKKMFQKMYENFMSCIVNLTEQREHDVFGITGTRKGICAGAL
jgi:hypothetical protein